MDIGSLNIKLMANPAAFEAGLLRAEQQLGRFGGFFRNFGGNVMAVMDSIAAHPVAAAVLAAMKAAQLLKAAVVGTVMTISALNAEGKQAIEQQVMLGKRFGLAAEAAAGLSLSARQWGIDVNTAGMATTAFMRHLGEAAAGSEEAARSFRAIGLDARELANMSTSDALAKVGDALKSIPEGAGRTAAAYAVLTRRGAALLPILQEGGAALKEAEQRAVRWGIATSAADARMVHSAVMAQRTAQIALDSIREGFSRRVAVALAPAEKLWADMTTGMVDLLEPVFAFARSGIDTIGGGIMDVVHGLRTGFADFAAPLTAARQEMAAAWQNLAGALNLTGDMKLDLQTLGRLAGQFAADGLVKILQGLTWIATAWNVVSAATSAAQMQAGGFGEIVIGVAHAAALSFGFLVTALQNVGATMFLTAHAIEGGVAMILAAVAKAIKMLADAAAATAKFDPTGEAQKIADSLRDAAGKVGADATRIGAEARKGMADAMKGIGFGPLREIDKFFDGLGMKFDALKGMMPKLQMPKMDPDAVIPPGLLQRIDQMRQGLQTPTEKFQEQIRQIQDVEEQMKKAGIMDADLIERAYADAWSKFAATIQRANNQPVAAAVRGSAEAQNAIITAQKSAQKQDPNQMLFQMQQAEQQQRRMQYEYVKQIKEKLVNQAKPDVRQIP